MLFYFFVVGSAFFQGTLIVTINQSNIDTSVRHIIGYVTVFSRSFDRVKVRAASECIADSGELDYNEAESSIRLLLHMGKQCKGSRAWLIPLIAIGSVSRTHTSYHVFTLELYLKLLKTSALRNRVLICVIILSHYSIDYVSCSDFNSHRIFLA